VVAVSCKDISNPFVVWLEANTYGKVRARPFLAPIALTAEPRNMLGGKNCGKRR
jgi:hypothetical protein